MSAMLENAVTWLEMANDALDKFKQNNTDVRWVRAACNHYQQSAEFFVKGLLEILGEEYEKGHDLENNAEKLISLINANDGEIWDYLKHIVDDLQYLSDKSGIIIKWEQRPRYNGENFTFKEKTILEAKEHIDNIDFIVKKLKLL